MRKASVSDTIWMPASWLYVGLGAQRSWLSLNNGDKLVVLFVALLGLAIPVRLGIQTGNYVTQHAPAWTGASLGAFTFVCVALTLTLGLANVRRGRLFQFLGETQKRKRTRILAEFGVACALSFLLFLVSSVFLAQQVSLQNLLEALGVATLGHSLIYTIQFLGADVSPSRSNPTGLTGMVQRSSFAPLISGSFLIKFRPTSSLFLLKANSNPLIWAVLLLTLLAFGGAAISLKSLLLGLSTISTVLLIVQLTLAEPRIGNGPTIGASAKNMPLHRALSDLWALAIPHLTSSVLAVALVIIDADGFAFTIALCQLVITLWIIWMVLIIRALPPILFAKSTRWLIAGAIIASQTFPVVIVLLMIVATIISTRDLMRLSLQGPAQWPR
jgi:hypothetical protein